MAGNDFEVNPDGLAAPASNMRSLGSRLDSMLKNLESTLDGLGHPWGDDKTGETFLKQYGSAREQILDGLQSMTEAVNGVADGLDTMRMGFQNTEQDVVDASNRLARDPNGSQDNGTLIPRDGTPLQPRLGTVNSDVPGGELSFVPREGSSLMPQTPGVPADGSVQWVSANDAVVPGGELSFVPREGSSLMPQTPGVPADGSVQWVSANDAVVPGGELSFVPREGSSLMPQTPGVPADGSVQWVSANDVDVPGGELSFAPSEGVPLTPQMPSVPTDE